MSAESQNDLVSPYTFDRQKGVLYLCGIDEAGRGPLVGPVVAGCVCIPEEAPQACPELLSIGDSKKLSKKQRESLYELITEHCYFGCGQADVDEIESINILHATMNAMTRAYQDMAHKVKASSIGTDMNLALIDGNRIPKDMPIDAEAIVKGDAKSLCIGAASIIAKVTRDRLLSCMAEEYPQYHWESNSGYGTKAHLDAIQEYGPTPYHRMGFAPLKNLKQAS